MKNIEKLAKKYIYWPELENPFQKNINFGENTLAQFHDILYKNAKSKKVDVEIEIAEFYALNQYLSQQRLKDGDVMNNELIQTYQAYKNKIDMLSEKMFSYIFLISMGEVRHCDDFNLFEEFDDNKSSGIKIYVQGDSCDKRAKAYKTWCSSSFFPKFKEVYQLLNDFYEEKDKHRQGLLDEMLVKFKTSNIKIEDTLQTLSIIFNKNNFEEGYGGEPWQKITDHALKFARGQLNAEVFVDQAFSLEHNGGCMFNKSIIFNSIGSILIKTVVSSVNKDYDSYISMSKTDFILNMQHSGELLNFLGLNNLTKEKIKSTIKRLNLTDSLLEKSNISIIKSLNSFFSDIKVEAAEFAQSLIIRNILEKEKNNLSTTNFQSYLKYQRNAYGNFQECITPDQDSILKLARKVTDNLNNPIKKRKIYSKKDVFFEVFDTAKVPVTHQNKETLGSKAFGLSEMNKMGLAVPKAAVWTCENFKSFDEFPDSWAKMLHTQMKGINSFNTDTDGNPVMVSIRSGAPVSMPGMMDTILNVGIDSSNYDYFVKKIGKSTTDECAIRFMKHFTKSYLGLDYKWPKSLKLANKKFKKILNSCTIITSEGEWPLTKERQIALSIEAVFQSWNSDRAVAYRQHHQIDNDIGTAVIMQHMVLGNLNCNSCTGVLFSRDCINGSKGIIGEFLVCGQGEEVVSGEVTPQNISEMKNWNIDIDNQLSSIASLLEEKTKQIQDIEFTVEDGRLYILQCRTAVSSSQAKINLLYESLNNKKMSLNDFLLQIEHNALLPQDTVKTKEPAQFTGLSANPGVIKGICIKDENDIKLFSKKAKDENLKFILISKETKPEHASIMMKSDAFLTQQGGFTSHAAILARSWSKPCIVGSSESSSLKVGDVITMDARQGKVWIGVKTIVKSNSNSIIKKVSKMIAPDNVNKQDKVVDKINNEKYWMNFGDKTKEVKSTVKKFNKFIDMGHLAVIKMSVAAKHKAITSLNI